MFLSGVVNIYQESKESKKLQFLVVSFSHIGEFLGVFSTAGKVTTQSQYCILPRRHHTVVPVGGSSQPVGLDPFVG